MYHEQDHQFSAEWHFFATSLGKSPCDGIGGTVKRLTANASLQGKQIMSANDMFEWCCENIQGIIFINVNSDYITQHVKEHKLDERYVKDSVKGSRIHHSFIPRNSELEMRIISADLTHSRKVPLYSTNIKNFSDFNPGMYVACIYDRDWYIGIVSEVSREHDEIYVKFMKREGRGLTWPKRDDKCWIPVFNWLGLVTSLNVQGHRGRTYIISEEELEKINSMKN